MKLQLEGSRLRGCWWQIKKFFICVMCGPCDFYYFLVSSCMRIRTIFGNFFFKLACSSAGPAYIYHSLNFASMFRFYEKWDSRITRVLWMTQISKNQTLHLFLGVVKKKSYIDFKKKSCFFADARAKLIKFWGFQMLQNYRVKNLNHKGQVV